MNKEIFLEDGYHELDSGAFFFILDGKFHNVNGPAVQYPDQSKYYYIKGKLHREDGPAIDSLDKKIYYLCGKEYSYDDWLKFKDLVAFI